MSQSSHYLDIAIAYGDGIGPEIMNATLHILKAANCPLHFIPVEVGEKVYLQGNISGIEQKTWNTLKNCKAFLKAPITTPQGGGFRSLNVTIRTALGLYANVRPCVAYAPFVQTKHPKMDVVIIRENEEDLYTGIEYQVTDNCAHALKIITRQGCERIIRYAFEYARRMGRKKVSCFTKDNILKITDGLFHKIFVEIAKEYPELEHEHFIVDIGSAKLADSPHTFDVIVLPNLYGDILSDVAAQIAGSVGLSGSANIGEQIAMFEAIHGSAPKRAGQNIANPSGLLLASIMMLVHLGLYDQAELIHNAWLSCIEHGIHTYDIYKEGISAEKVGTIEFADYVIDHFGRIPKTLTPITYKETKHTSITSFTSKHTIPDTAHATVKEPIAVDIYIRKTKNFEKLVIDLQKIIENSHYTINAISSRGLTVWPDSHTHSSISDHLCIRFSSSQNLKPEDSIYLQKKLYEKNFCITTISYVF